MAVDGQISEDGSILTIRITGHFDITACQDFGQVFKDKPASVSKTVIDMAEVEYIDTSALGMLLKLRERSGADSAQIDITNCNPAVKNVFKTTNLDKLFNIQ
jgi:anti-anti-sigma factor